MLLGSWGSGVSQISTAGRASSAPPVENMQVVDDEGETARDVAVRRGTPDLVLQLDLCRHAAALR